MDYSTALINLIDQRIDQAALKPTKMGTVLSREGATARALVVFDGGSGVAQPVKCFDDVVVDVDDRVGLAKLEGEWVIIGTYSDRTRGDSLAGVEWATGGSTTSASFVDMPNSPFANLTKYRDSTQLQIFIACSMTSTVSATVVEIAGGILFPDASSTDQVLFHRAINAANDHRDMSGGRTTPGTTLPAGVYNIYGRWRRTGGSGTLTMDSNDTVTIWAREVTS